LYYNWSSLLKEKAWSWLPHLLFSLLKGRPVVIQADPEHKNEVVHLVQALSIFVAGPTAVLALLSTGKPAENIPQETTTTTTTTVTLTSTSSSFSTLQNSDLESNVVPWVNKPLSLASLAWIRLAGTSKQFPIPLSIKHYVTVLDYERSTLVAPIYREGDIITRILSEKKQWPNESTFLAFVHSVLYEAAIHSCLFYHECCIKTHLEKETGHKSSRTLTSSSPPNGTKPPHTKSSAEKPDGTSTRVKNPNPKSNENQSTRNPERKLHTHHTISNFSTLRAQEKAKLEKTGNSAGPGLQGERTPKDASAAGGPDAFLQQKSLSLTGVTLKQAEMEHAKQKQQHLVLQHQQRISMNDTKTEFFKHHHIKESDAEIVEFFAEVVKRQQSFATGGVYPSKSGTSTTDSKRPMPIKLDFSQTFYFEHKPKRSRRGQ